MRGRRQPTVVEVLVTDSNLRELERRFRASGSVAGEAAWLRARAQAGELGQSTLELSANCGHEASRDALAQRGARRHPRCPVPFSNGRTR